MEVLRMKKFYTKIIKNWKHKLLALGLAILVWLYVNGVL
jgi:hypothetical protein